MNRECPQMVRCNRVATGQGGGRPWRALIAVLLALALPASPVAAQDPPFEDIRAVDAEMAAIGYRLAVANAPLCDRLEPGLGLGLHTPGQYARDVRAAATRHFGFDGPVGVEAVIAGSPAAAAGVRPDDTLTGAGTGTGAVRFAPADPAAEASTAALIRATEQLATLPPDRPLTLQLRRAGAAQDVTVTPVPACRTRFEVVIGDTFQAKADGTMVQLGSRFFADYPELVAAPLAHELAHNILRHRARLEEKGVDYGLLSGFGRNVRYFRQTELEADILSVSLLANAGYDPRVAVRFWQAFGPSHAGGPFRSRSHPAWRDRVATIERAIAALGPDRPHRPAILAARDRPLDGDWQALLVRAR